jgi:hypothetical protein
MPRTRWTTGERHILWIEKYCVVPSGPDRGQRVKLTPLQKETVRRIYDSGEKNVPVKRPLSAYLALLHVCGPEAVQPWAEPPRFEADIFTVWNSAGLSLRAVLKRDCERIVCPKLGTIGPQRRNQGTSEPAARNVRFWG